MSKHLDTPIYNASFVAKLIGISTSRVRRWLQGYDYTYTIGFNQEIRKGHKDPILNRSTAFKESYASFLDLIDLLFVKQFLNYGISLQKIRKALSEAEKIIESHHFAQSCFFTDGENIYLQVKNNADALLDLLSNGQWVIPEIIKKLSYQIAFNKSTKLAQRWYPLGKDGLIVLDPQISFGNPTILGKGITTTVIYDSYIAEKRRIKSVCIWLDLKSEEVQAAIKFEEMLNAA